MKEFKKAVVGQQIKIVKVAYEHCPEVKIGDVLNVDETDHCGDIDFASVTCDRNVFYDKDEEYEIIGGNE